MPRTRMVGAMVATAALIPAAMTAPAFAWDNQGSQSTQSQQSSARHDRGRHCGWFKRGGQESGRTGGRGCPAHRRNSGDQGQQQQTQQTQQQQTQQASSSSTCQQQQQQQQQTQTSSDDQTCPCANGSHASHGDGSDD